MRQFRLVLTRGERTVDDVAESLGVPTNLLHSWKKKYGDEIGLRHVRATETPEYAELRELRKKLKSAATPDREVSTHGSECETR